MATSLSERNPIIFFVLFSHFMFAWHDPIILGSSPTKANKTKTHQSLFSCYGGALIGKFADGGSIRTSIVYTTVCTLWKFSATQIFREFSLWDFSGIFAFFWRMKITQIKNSESLKLQKWHFLDFYIFQNWFHGKMMNFSHCAHC